MDDMKVIEHKIFYCHEKTYTDFSGGRLPEVRTRSNRTLVLLSSVRQE